MTAPQNRVPCPLCNSSSSRRERVVAGYRLERCARCGHVFMNPQYSVDEVSLLYTDRDTDHLVTVYSQIAASESVRAESAEKLRLFERLIGTRGRLLDFACG